MNATNEPVTWTTLRIQNATTPGTYKDYSPTQVGATVAQNWDGTLSYPTSGAMAPDGAYDLYYTITDIAGNVTGSLVGPLTPNQIIVDTVAPTMTSVVGTTVQGAGDTIAVQFDENVVSTSGSWTDGNELTFQSPTTGTGTAVDLTDATYVFDSNTNTLTVTLGSSNTVNDHFKNGDIVKAVPVTGAIKDLAGNELTASKDSAAITGDTSSPTIALSYSIDHPVKNGDTEVITATFSEAMTSAPQIAINTTGTSVTATAMTPDTINQAVWTYSWNVPTGSDGTATITITGADLAGNTISDSSNSRLIDNTLPTVTTPLTSPVVDTVYRTNAILSFTPADTATAVSCSYSLVNSIGITNASIPCTNGTTISNASIPTGLVDGRNSIEVTVTDAAGNTVPSGPVSFVYDNNQTLTVGTIPAQDFSKIQDAVNSTISGDTVEVQPGTYAESVLIGTDITLSGVGTAKPVITGNDATYNYIIKVDSADGVTLDNLEINGGGSTASDNAFDYGILVTGSGTLAKPTVVSNSVIKNIWKISSNGIDVNAASYALIHDNVISSFHKRGIRFTNSDGKVYSNDVVGDAVNGVNRVQNLINLWGGSNVEIYQNTLHGGKSITLGTWSSPAIFVSSYMGGGASSANIHDNDIYNVDIGVTVGSYYVFSGTDNSHAIIKGNNIYNVTRGVNFERNDVTAVITFNQFVNDIHGITSTDGHGGPTPMPNITAENNWWGSANGPYNLLGNHLGTGSPVDNQVDFSPFCTAVPVYDTSAGTWSCSLASVDPIASFDLTFDTNPHVVNQNSNLTVTAKDAGGYTVVNDNSTKMNIAGDNGSSFGSILLTMGVLGTTGTTITNTNTGLVNVSATEVGGNSSTGTGTITFGAGNDVTAPVISNVQVINFGTNTATVTWTTNEASKSQVEYGTTSGYGILTSVNANLVTTHSVTLTGLTDGTVYHFRVISVDASTNVGTSGDNVFTTTGVDNTPPVITLIGQNPMTLTIGDTFTDPGATANDNVDGNITSTIVTNATAVDTTVAGTYTVTYNVQDVALNFATTATRTVIVVDPAVSPVTPTISLSGTILVSSYTASAAATRFANGLQFTTTNAQSVTVNGTSVTPDTNGVITAVSLADATTLGLHVYNVVVTSSTGGTANITVSYSVVADFNDTAPLAVTGTDAIANGTGTVGYATADGTYANGWRWVYHITVPTSETQFQMKFSDFLNANGVDTIPAASDIQFYTAQASANADEAHAVGITAADTFSPAITLTSDLLPTTPGRQIDVVVEMKVPTGSAGGSYSGSYGVKTI